MDLVLSAKKLKALASAHGIDNKISYADLKGIHGLRIYPGDMYVDGTDETLIFSFPFDHSIHVLRDTDLWFTLVGDNRIHLYCGIPYYCGKKAGIVDCAVLCLDNATQEYLEEKAVHA